MPCVSLAAYYIRCVVTIRILVFQRLEMIASYSVYAFNLQTDDEIFYLRSSSRDKMILVANYFFIMFFFR